MARGQGLRLRVRTHIPLATQVSALQFAADVGSMHDRQSRAVVLGKYVNCRPLAASGLRHLQLTGLNSA